MRNIKLITILVLLQLTVSLFIFSGFSQNKKKVNAEKKDAQNILQTELIDLDQILSGLRAGPCLINDKFGGYKIFLVSEGNVLYEIGLRNGDIIKK